ncbi:class I adenylate-forming enzyme family protein [Tropicimonas isoalkanivorans]|uniref:Acyl-CoA synthetase (AMP-forming)/AMP-acid ligase II n=1 Tax=Tropicimonas isoalkanivorans TaxID=441112 RepID=A0A1I1HS36_9RHOB|nr:AMP-binding protein [Tropicimonas isoalkanivorans]SFC26744.1 Acyl-CoA synthetase (AMP-forming)/AMP-acid ligase II [Tropicimonas isoalkanivorans]
MAVHEPGAPDCRTVPDLVDRAAQEAPEAPALLTADVALSYGDLARITRDLAAELKARGLEPGDRLLIVAENDLASPVLMLAAERVGAWPAILNARVPAVEIAKLHNLIDPRLTVVTSDAGSEKSRAAMEGHDFAPLMIEGAGTVGCAVHAPGPADTTDPPAGDVALVLFSSGTTGIPKAVLHGHTGLLKLGETLRQVRQVCAGGRYDGGAPLSHVMGISTLMSVLAARASLRLLPRLDIPDLAAQLAAGQLTHLSYVPTVYTRLLDHIDHHGIDVSGHRLEYISSGGAPLDPTLKARVEALFGTVLVNGYGMTECCPIARTPPEPGAAPGYIGKAEPGSEMTVRRRDGTEAERGETGEIWARAAATMLGYFRNPDATKAAMRPGGWVATGDLGSMDRRGGVTIAGRAKEMIIRSGFNVFPAEVEDVINSHPAVVQSAVFGKPAPNGDEYVVAVVQLRPGETLTWGTLVQWLKERLAAYKVPHLIHFSPDLPIGPTGKILKRELARQFG